MPTSAPTATSTAGKDRLPFAELLLNIEANREHGVVDVQLPGALGSKFAFEAGRLSAVSSPFLPPWTVSLQQRGHVNASTLESVRAGSHSVLEMLNTLRRCGLVSRDDLLRLAGQRALTALLPLLGTPGEALQFRTTAPHRDLPRPGVLASGVLQEAERRLQQRGLLGVQRRPDERFSVRTDLENEAGQTLQLDGSAWNVLALLSEHLTLAEAGRRAHLPWDELMLAVQNLERRGLIEAQPAETPAAPRGARLKTGDAAPLFTLRNLHGERISLDAFRQSKLLLTFNRQAGCAFCNPRTQRLLEAYPSLRAAGVEVVSVFGSTVEALQEHVGRLQPPFQLLSDPAGDSHERYRVGHSLLGFLDPRNLSTMVRGVRMPTFGAATDGELLRMPAEFLIGPGLRIAHAHYNTFAADFLPVEDILGWATASG